MQNIDELINSLTDNYEKMKDGEMSHQLGRELTNSAGKVMVGLRLKLDYNKEMGSKNKINFLEDIKI